jgi:NADH dehydrogenase
MNAKSQRILVTGATGFIGQAVVPLLLADGHEVVALTRRTSHWPFIDDARLIRADGDMTDEQSIRTAITGCDGVIHLAAAKSDEKDSALVNVRGARFLARAAEDAGVRWIVNVSTQSARLKRRGAYGRTKAEADAVLATSRVPTVTLRSSLVYGDATSGVFGSLVKFCSLPAIPVFGDGKARFRPIHRDDLALGILAAAQQPGMRGKTYDVGGTEALSFDDLLRAIMETQDVRRPILHFPIWLGLIGARVASILPHPPLTVSNVLGGAEDLDMDIQPFLYDTGVVPRSFAVALADVFGSPEERAAATEARAVLAYVLSAFRGAPAPTAGEVARYRDALRRLGLPPRTLDRSVVRSRRRIAGLDARTRLRHPDCVLRKKLLVAAAIRECDPSSAPFLLPQDLPKLRLFLRAAWLTVRAASTILGGLLIPIPADSLRRNAGLR